MKICITYKKHPLDWAEIEIEGEIDMLQISGMEQKVIHLKKEEINQTCKKVVEVIQSELGDEKFVPEVVKYVLEQCKEYVEAMPLKL